MKSTLINLLFFLTFLNSPVFASGGHGHHGHDAHSEQEEEHEEGPNQGRMLREGDFALELKIVEAGVPPEYRIWATHKESAVSPGEIDVEIELIRLGNVTDHIHFAAESDYLRGDTVVYEPHSFAVHVHAKYRGKSYDWKFDNFEGRTQIHDEIAKSMQIQTGYVGPATFKETIPVYGKLYLPADARRHISARFDGQIRSVHVRRGQEVTQGQLLFTIESNESLQSYPIHSPISGLITQLYANKGEHTSGRELMEITNTKQMLVELAVFPLNVSKIKPKANIQIWANGHDKPIEAKLLGSRTGMRHDQARLFWTYIDNKDGLLAEGMFVKAEIEINQYEVPLAVKRSALQSFRDFTVVYAKFGEEYEVRMLELGGEAGEWVEVISGIQPGIEYVIENSYIIKADIEKSGASHDH